MSGLFPRQSKSMAKVWTLQKYLEIFREGSCCRALAPRRFRCWLQIKSRLMAVLSSQACKWQTRTVKNPLNKIAFTLLEATVSVQSPFRLRSRPCAYGWRHAQEMASTCWKGFLEKNSLLLYRNQNADLCNNYISLEWGFYFNTFMWITVYLYFLFYTYTIFIHIT